MKIKKLHGQGNHLILDGFSEANMGDVDFIRKFLLESVKKLRMNTISKPLVLYHKAKEKSESGITGIIILAESNITIHTYPEKKWFCLDVYSCNEFNIKKIVNYLIKKLDINKYKLKILKRGFY